MRADTTLYFVAIHLPGSPDQHVWDELDRRMELEGYSKVIGGEIMLPRGMYLSPECSECDDDCDDDCHEHDEGGHEEVVVSTYEEAEVIARECWPIEPVVFAFEATRFFGPSKEEAEARLREMAETN